MQRSSIHTSMFMKILFFFVNFNWKCSHESEFPSSKEKGGQVPFLKTSTIPYKRVGPWLLLYGENKRKLCDIHVELCHLLVFAKFIGTWKYALNYVVLVWLLSYLIWVTPILGVDLS